MAGTARERGARERRRGRAVWLVVAVLALLLLVLGVRRGHMTGGGAPPEPESEHAPASPAGGGAQGGPGAGRGGRAGPVDSAALAKGAPPAVRDMPQPRPEEKYPYPPWSQPLTEGSDPATTVAEDNPVDTKKGLHVVVGSRKQVVHPPDPIVIDMKVLNRLGAAVPVGNPVARFRAEKTTVESGPWFEVPFEDDGSHAYVATFFPSPDQQQAFYAGGEHIYGEVKFDAPEDLGLRRYPLVLMYTREPHARVSGTYSDTVSGGNLVISVGVTADQAGTYRLIGSLYSGDGQRAIAFANATSKLPAGDGTIPLSIFGKVLHDTGVDGPYELRYVMLFEQVKPGEEIPGDTVDPAYTTAAYRAKSFSADPYQPPPDDMPVVDMNSPSQQGKPPPMFSEDERRASRAAANPPVTIGQGPAAK